MQFRRPKVWLAAGGALVTIGVVLLVGRTLSSAINRPPRTVIRELQLETRGDLRVHWNDSTGVPDFLIGALPTTQPTLALTDPGGAAIEALSDYADAFAVKDAATEFEIRLVESDKLGQTHVRLDQQYAGIRVWARDMVVHFDVDGSLQGFSGEYVPGLDVDSAPTLAQDAAVAAVLRDLTGEDPTVDSPAELLIYVDDANEGVLTWYVPISFGNGERLGYFVDAHTGAVTHVTPLALHRLERLVYDAELKDSLPGQLVAVEGEVPRDPAGASVYRFIGEVYNYFKDVHNRDSFDNRGAAIVSVIHSPTLGNSYWNGEMLVFGDEDDFITNQSDAFVDDIAGHEYTHAVTQFTAGLIYESQSGALNEHFSDAFAIFIDREDYQLFEDNSKSPPIPQPWLRDLIDPSLGGNYDPRDPLQSWGQPTDMSEFANLRVARDSDWGGVHINSGIPNHLLYLVAEAIGKDKSEQIWYRTLTVYLSQSSDFADFSTALLQSADDLYGSVEVRAIEQALKAQGMAAGAGPAPTPVPTTSPRQTPVATPQVPAAAGCEELVDNGGFEGRTVDPWVEVTNIGYPIVGPDFPFTGSNSAWLGGTDEEAVQFIVQPVTIPANARSVALSFWYFVENAAQSNRSPETSFAVGFADEDGNILHEFAEYLSSEADEEWLQAAFDASDFAGDSVLLVFAASLGKTNPSNFFLDDVSLLACTSGENPVDTGGADPNSIDVTGTVTDSRTGKAVAGATIYILQPGVSASQAAADGELSRSEVLSFATSDKRGFFALPDRVPRGSTYSAIVVASGYKNIVANSVLRITDRTPDPLELEVEMQKRF